MSSSFDDSVATRYHMYNSLFLNLPYSGIYRTGTFLPLLQQACESGLAKGADPKSIIERFFTDYIPEASSEEKFNLLFQFIQYAERQVVLFDSIEDAAFGLINNLEGKGTVGGLLLRANAEGVTDELKKKLESFRIRIVLTAHPTQFYPGNVLAIINDLEQAIKENHLEHINLLLKQLGKTPFINKEKPSPYDEAVSLCWFLENVFYSVIPSIIHRLANGLQIKIEDWKNHQLISIGFWPGGDRDGNPFVTHEVTLKVAQRLQETILKCYYRDLRFLKRRLTFKGVEPFIANAERKVYPMAYGGHGEIYQSPQELLDDLEKAKAVLISEHDGLFLDLLNEFILKVRIFGFYFAAMDIRQDSRKHRQVWNVMFSQTNKTKLEDLPVTERMTALLNFKTDPLSLDIQDDTTNEVLQSLEAIGQIQEQNGLDSCSRYIISNCQSALDVMMVFQLAKLVLGNNGDLRLDVVPLFETIDDLANAPRIMRELYTIPEYRTHLISRGGKQTIMLGFSDGTKDGGYLRANWSIFEAKETLTAITREEGFVAVFFDGRGGPPARGGGNTHDFYASLGDTIEDEEVQITIQGQTISSNFGKPVTCRFNLEQLLSAGVENDVFKTTNALTQEQTKLLSALAQRGHTAYRKLKEDELFVPYLEKVTPLSFFGDANVGSRPVKRSQGSLKFEDLRAIPFVGSWALMKQNIPGFYGVGSAIQALKQEGRMEELKLLFKSSLFFRTLLSNSMMSLTKTNYAATAYLSGDPEFARFWKMMYDEFNLSARMILEVSGLRELMENNPVNRDSVRLRERIVLPLVVIQQYALQTLRAADEKDGEREQQLRKLVVRCMFGIINAARNSA